MPSQSPITVTLPVSLTVESLLQVIATLSEKIQRLEASGAVEADSDEVPPQVVAAISAAVYATVGANARIVKVSPMNQTLAWSAEGRRAIFASRTVGSRR